jgi:predicted transcriptional regulator of viral defense system
MKRSSLKPLDDRLAGGKTTFTSRELREELKLSPAATSNLLARWQKAGLVDRVARGRFAIRQIGLLGTRASSEDVALAVAALVEGRDHRIAYHSALDLHGLLTRPLRTIQVATPHRFSSASVSGRPLQVIFERVDTLGLGTESVGFGARASNLERALLDAASRPDLVGGYFPLAEALVGSEADASRLLDLADQLRAGPAVRRIGSLADRLQLPGLAGELEPLVAPQWDLDLDPGLKEDRGAFRDSRWRIGWPVDPRALERELAE